MSRYRIHVLLLLAALAAVGILSQSCKKLSGPSETRQVFGTAVTITVYDAGMKADALKPIADEIFQMFADWDKKVVQPGPENQVAGISRGAGVQSVSTDAAVFEMMMKALRLYDASGKLFDIRYGPMLDAWGFDKQPRVPTQAELDTAKTLVADGGMFVAGNSILLAKKGMRFDTREIAIGHALDMAAAKLAEKGIRSAMICTPRVCRTMGDAPDKRGFPVALPHPISGEPNWAEVWAPVGGTALASAGTHRFEAGGKSYHGLLDPRTGMPAVKCAGAVVQSTDAATAQALAYAAFVSGGTGEFDPSGKSAVGGMVILNQEKEGFNNTATGSLANKFEVSK